MVKNKRYIKLSDHPPTPSKGGERSAYFLALPSFSSTTFSPFGGGWGVVAPLITSFIFLLTFNSCVIDKTEDPAVRQKRLEETITQKLADRRYERMKNCQQAAIDIAEQRVDSILLAEAKLITIDTTDKPIKPIKPTPPTVAIPKDSSDVKPLFEEIPDSLK